MPQMERFPPDDPREWLRRARSNLLRAQSSRQLEGVYAEDICFDAQQAAEKALKAVLLSCRADFPKTHNLAALLTLIRKQALDVPESVAQAPRLTEYAVMTRYPGGVEPVSEEDRDAAIACAEAVVEWATKIVMGQV